MAMRKIQEGDLKHTFGKNGFEIIMRHWNADFQLAAGDPGFREKIMKSKVSHATQCRFSPCGSWGIKRFPGTRNRRSGIPKESPWPEQEHVDGTGSWT